MINRDALIKSLKSKWNKEYTQSYFLKSVSIEGEVPFRGIKDSTLDINFPLTVICGQNGTGKTTFLQLALLGFHSISRNIPLPNGISYYNFLYFFKRSKFDSYASGITITWNYTNNKKFKIIRKSSWMKKPIRRPNKGTDFIGISRILPAFEKKRYEAYFSNHKERKPCSYHTDLLKYLKYILGKEYVEAKFLYHTNSGGTYLLTCYGGYSGFSAGAGEEALVSILSSLLSAANGSIIAIEEIEIGLHPKCLSKLIDVMLEIIDQNNLQIFITSHSPDFLCNCPRESLIFAERSGAQVLFEKNPNIEYAIHKVGGRTETSLYIVCEDKTAEKFIKSCSNRKTKPLILVRGYGGKTELVAKADALKISGHKVLIAWDGDFNLFENKETYQSQADSKEIPYIILPSNNDPEHYIIDKLKQKPNLLKDNYMLSDADTADLITRLSGLTDEHLLFKTISEFIGDELNESNREKSEEKLCDIIFKEFKNEFENIIQKINSLISD